jgi:hypothetical protein
LELCSLQWMQERQYIQGQVDWSRVGNDTLTWFQSLSAQVSSSHIFGTLGIPATSGLAVGLVGVAIVIVQYVEPEWPMNHSEKSAYPLS